MMPAPRAFAVAIALLAAGPAPAGEAALGARLYHEGIGADGQPVQGIVQGDVRVSGAAFACVSCHRPSGFGSSEGGRFVPSITGPQLFAPTTPDRNRMFRELFQEAQPADYWARVRQPRMRPAYDTGLLAHALRTGEDPSGRPLDRAMPRYAISDEDVANLAAFLRGLSAEISPGVEAGEIHLATIIGPDADPAAAEAMLATLRAYVDWMNLRTAGDTRNPSFSPNYRSNFIDAYRMWRLHVWRLQGPPATWRAQLARLYAGRPVFAVVSGLVETPWDEIGAFCDAERLPCLLPNAELLPEGPTERHYSVYFNRGLAVEAEVAAVDLAESLPDGARVVQLHADGPRGTRPAAVFARALARVTPGLRLDTLAYDGAAALVRHLAALDGPYAPQVLVLWPADPVADLAALARARLTVRRIYLPSAAMEAARAELPPALDERLRILWPYEEPDGYHPRQFRIRAWMHSRRLAVTHPRIQLQTYYAMSLVEFGLMHLLTDFYRDYFLELVEHEAENELNPGTHPELALGPGQRVASKGAFVAVPARGTRPGYAVVSDWIVP